MESVQFKSNVKIIDPNSTIIYACKSTVLQESSTTFIGPETLDVKPGDVLSSAQSGGIIHKIRSTSNEGNNYKTNLRNLKINQFAAVNFNPHQTLGKKECDTEEATFFNIAFF